MNVQFPSVGRQSLLREYQKTPESAPLSSTQMVAPMAPHEYRFDDQLERSSGDTAGALIRHANDDAAHVTHHAGLKIGLGLAELGAGLVAFGTCLALPLVLLPAGLIAMGVGVNTVRHGTDALRAEHNDRHFADDVARFSQRAHQGSLSDPSQQYHIAGARPSQT